jgi:hypothetical protein
VELYNRKQVGRYGGGGWDVKKCTRKCRRDIRIACRDKCEWSEEDYGKGS